MWVKIKKLELGIIAIIFGALLLSLELYGLKIIQQLERIKGSWYTNAFKYANETPISLALIVTIGVIIYGFVLTITSGEDKNKNGGI